MLRNECVGGNHWIRCQLRGTRTNRDGIGARIRVVSGDLTQVDEVHSGRGYQSHYGTAVHFGIGQRQRIERVEVRWIGGGTDVLRDLEPDRVITIVEGEHAR